MQSSKDFITRSAPTGQTYTTTAPTSFTQRVENAASNLLGGRVAIGTTGATNTYTTAVPATTVSTANYGTGYGVTGGKTSGATNVKFGYGTSGVGNTYTTSAVNRAAVTSVPITTGATVVTSRPAETYTTSYTTGHVVPPTNYTTTQGIFNFIKLYPFLKLLFNKYEESNKLLNQLLSRRSKE